LEQRHSGLGIASCLISLAAGTGLFGLLVLALIASVAVDRHANIDPRHTARLLFGLLALGLLLLEMVALGLGIAGCMQADRKRLFAILGTVFAGVPLLVAIAALVALA